MAKKESRQKKGGKKSKIRAFLTDERTHVAMGIVLFLCTLYVFLALISFFFTGAADQSIVLSPSASREEMKRQVLNWTGVRGAIMAERIVNDGFGIAVYGMFLFPFVLSLRLMGLRVMSLWKSFFFPALFMLWGALFFEFCFGALMSGSFLCIGGAFGENFCDWLISNIGFPGTLFVILGTGLVFAVFAFRATVPALNKVFGKIKKRHSDVEQKQEKEAEREKAVKIGDDIVPPEWVKEDEEPEAETNEIVIETTRATKPETGSVQIETVNREENWMQAREKMHYAATIAGMAFANAFLGVCHSLAHALGSTFHLPHGMANALMLSYVIEYNATDNPTKQGMLPQYKYPWVKGRYARIADMLHLANDIPGDTPEDRTRKTMRLVRAIEQLKKDVGIPGSLREAGITESDFLARVDEMALHAFDDQCTGANPRYPLVSELKELYRKAFYGELPRAMQNTD